ncbi:MAG: UDP-3-O-[3-hydroxymyristoyl] glucosamine N-acyltransferase [Hyphomicrobiales bacterium]|jgi:UDP-3-O-[3-hydroxymyristoyl] glucosamine N-acyltransferase|nr:UDP-3-O-[3-hydroxymyristoyl] glucosamine N-acyltransferase [Hyphomicrobiales bacterium]
MTEPRFFERPEGLTAQEIAALTGAVLRGSADRRIGGIAPLDRASPLDLSFMQSPKYLSQFTATQAGICLTTEKFAANAPAHMAVLVTPAPYRAFVAVAQKLYPGAMRPSSLFEASGVSPTALVHPSARLESGVVIDPAAVIGPRAEIGAGSIIAPGAVIGPDVRIGRGCVIGASATIVHALIGDRVIIHAGARIGQDGFGYLPGAAGHGKVPQVGRVIIQDGVEIGANSTLDRGAIRDTVIGEGTKIDNLVQIAHNVEIGRHCVLAAYTGISGSCSIGDYVMMGGRVGVTDNITIGAGAMIAAGSGVMSNVPAGEKWGGAPAQPARDWLKANAALRRLARRGRADGDNE